MNLYVGKICPYCKSVFTADDDVVVCSDCDMPHHKDCWIENNGCTTFGCRGTISTANGGSSVVTETELQFDDSRPGQASAAAVFCRKCGAPVREGNAFCSRCGASVVVGAQSSASHSPVSFTAAASAQPYTQTNAYRAQIPSSGFEQSGDAALLIRENSDYYVAQLNALRAQNKKTSWNWSAFLLAPFWLIYRKLYAYGAAFLGVSLILALFGDAISAVVSVAADIAFGIFGNYLYQQKIEKDVNMSLTMTEPYKSNYITKNGGTNPTATALAAVGYVVLSVILMAL